MKNKMLLSIALILCACGGDAKPPFPNHVHDDSGIDSGMDATVTMDAHVHDDDAEIIDGHHVYPDAPQHGTGEWPAGFEGTDTLLITSTTEQPVNADTGNFRTFCVFSHMNTDDPIVYPGVPGASHLHTFFGNTNVNFKSTADTIKNDGNSTCRGGIANRSAYWIPTMLDSEGNPVAPEGNLVYYKSGYLGVKPPQIVPLPDGLRIIAGDKSSHSAQSNTFWTCRNAGLPHYDNIPTDCGKGEPIQLTVDFPQCWDGVNLDSADHKSHMAFSEPDVGCPATHPVALPEITFNIIWNVPQTPAGWHLSSDMYDFANLGGGYSAHGDYFEGWQSDVQKTFVENCVSKYKDCHAHLLGDGRMIYADWPEPGL